MAEEKFVAFKLDGMNNTDKMVNNLLRASIKYMNDKAKLNPHGYDSMSGSDVEKLSCSSMKEVAPIVSFPRDRIDLVSGHVFPDIILHKFNYGVEIKSTQKDVWKSTGSSIVESSRCKEANRIYMLFGKLGGAPEFRCKPYQQCLSNIAVTHAPRYLIDMELSAEDNIFSKMHTEYDDFRIMDEPEKISKVRQYYIKKAKEEHKVEMPWWMGDTTSVNLSIFNDLSTSTKDAILTRAYILFSSIYTDNTKLSYKQVALWLCNTYSLLCYNVRDMFSASGQLKVINGEPLKRPYPHIVKEVLKRNTQIKSLLKDPDEDIMKGIQDFWDFDYDRFDLYSSWINMVETCFKANPSLKHIPIRQLLENCAIPK